MNSVMLKIKQIFSRLYGRSVYFHTVKSGIKIKKLGDAMVVLPKLYGMF